MAKVAWPPAEARSLIGKSIDRVDGPVKSTGAAKYSYDITRPGMLWAKLVTSPHALAVVERIDTSAAEALPGVKGVWKENIQVRELTREQAEKEELTEAKGYIFLGAGPVFKVYTSASRVQYVGQIVAAVAAETEEIATEASNLVKVEYKVQEPSVRDTDPELSKERPSKRDAGNVDDMFLRANLVYTGYYGLPVITHCCLEPHGQVTEVRDGELYVWPSTQNVSKYADRALGEALNIEQNKIHVDCQHMGGGFGSKFSVDKWGTVGAILSKETGRPVKLMLDRDLELMIAGNRPSAYAKVKIGATTDGTVTAVEAEVWGTGGNGGYNAPPVPYVFSRLPHSRLTGKGIRTNRGGQRAWRAPHHPQGCLITMSAFADVAAAMKIDELDFFQRNLGWTERSAVYKEELEVAAQMIDYNKKKHPRGDKTPGPIKRGLGVSMHTWAGRGHPSECDVTINPDGSVEAKIGTQDLGVGTRTCIGIVVAETLGLPLDAVKVLIGKNEYPPSDPSGGSTTIGGISVSSREAATAALNELAAKVAPRLNAQPDALEARAGFIRIVGSPNSRVSWKDACAMLGPNPITKRGVNVPGPAAEARLISQGVGGVQIADVSVDIETGVVTMNEMVAVQDCGLIIDLKTAESQVYGALIMGITYGLYEEAVYDMKTGRMLNADMEFYRLAGIKDVGKLKVRMMTSKSYEDRGVIGLGEPPVISPGAAISNAVANAIGVRVPNLPLSPDRVLNALAQKGGMA